MKEPEASAISQQRVSHKKKHSLLFFVSFPAVAMLLGWGLRGFIGGGPYGAMIPGAMVMIAICMLLDIPVKFAAIGVVFGTAGTAMGGEMTYGQTLSFLRSPGTIWWGLAGTSLKGGVWGLMSGLFIGVGLVYPRIKNKTILTGFLIFLIAFLVGLKLINDPKILYFSNPIDRPRNESWAGLLFGTVGLLIYLKINIAAEEFRVVSRFAWYGLIGGSLGFGLGSLWLAIGAQYGAQFLIVDWWKMMEFSFGFLLGGFLGYAAWRSNNAHKHFDDQSPVTFHKSFTGELMLTIALGFFIYGAVPVFESYLETINNNGGIFFASMATIGRVLVNFTFIGCLLIIIALRWPYLAFQIAVTLTFCHCMIDLLTDARLFPASQSSGLMITTIITTALLAISVLVALFQRKQFVLKSMFLILVWSTMAVAIIRMLVHGEFSFAEGHSFMQIIVGDLFVFNVFIISAVIVSVMIVKNKAFQARVRQKI